MKFANPRNDIAFKKIFGDEGHKDVLIAFLNAVLGLEGEHEIAEVQLLDPYQKPRIELLKYTLLDIQAVDRRGVRFIVEMQVENVAGLRKRFQYYAAKSYVGQIARAEEYPRLNQVIFIGILDFEEFSSSHWLSRHLLLNRENGAQELADLEFNFIELPKFAKGEEELESAVEKWVWFLKHAEELEVIPHHAEESVSLRHAYEVANQFTWSREELEYYDSCGMRRQDERGKLEAAEEKGKAEGRAEGKAEGKAEGVRETALRMLEQGLEVAMVARCTGLSEGEVAGLASSVPPGPKPAGA